MAQASPRSCERLHHVRFPSPGPLRAPRTVLHHSPATAARSMLRELHGNVVSLSAFRTDTNKAVLNQLLLFYNKKPATRMLVTLAPKEMLNKAFPFMVRQGSPEHSRRALQPHSRRYAHEWKQPLAVRFSRLRSGQALSLSVEGLNQHFPKRGESGMLC
jgi:hypothetical protein